MRKQIEDLDLQIHPRRPDEAIEASSNERSQIDKEETGSLTGAKRGIWNPGSGGTAVVGNAKIPSYLTESVKTGCGTCRMLLGSLETYRTPKYHESISTFFFVFIGGRLSCVQRG
jgi:hypothetical protein